MSLSIASLLLLLGLTSTFACPRTDCYCNPGSCMSNVPRNPPQTDTCVVCRETLIRVLRGVISLISQLYTEKTEKEQDDANMKVITVRTCPKSFSFFPIYFRNSVPSCSSNSVLAQCY